MLKDMAKKATIQIGTILRTRHENSYDWVTTVILKTYNNYIEIEQVEDYLNRILMIGDKLICKFVDKNYIYTVDSIVYNIKFATRSVILMVNNIDAIKNTRDSYRFDVYLSSSFSPAGSVGETYSVVTDVSCSGISIITRSILQIGDQVNLNIYPARTNIISVICEVKREGEIASNRIYGFKIVKMDEASNNSYYEYIKKLQKNENNLQKRAKALNLT